jgi:sugar phosphate isomerase/epimerase
VQFFENRKIAPDPFAQIGAVTDEFSPDNLDRALDAMAGFGMTFAELRVVNGKNIIDHTDSEIDAVRASVEARGMRILSIASPVLKCTLPDAPPVASHIQQDMFSAAYTFDDQPALARRALEIAERSGARIIRVFPAGARSIRRRASVASRPPCAILPCKLRREAW